MWSKIRAAVLCLAVFAGCTKGPSDKTPEGALESYVAAAFSVQSAADKEKLLRLSAGEAQSLLSTMSDEDFVSRFAAGKLRFVGLKTKDRRAERDGGVSMVYELSYEEVGKGKGPITFKKIAYLVPVDAGWRIRGTKNIKEFVEHVDPMVIEITK